MAQQFGTVTRNEKGNYEGTLSLGYTGRIRIVRNDSKSAEKQPDYKVFAADGSELGGGWIRTGKTSGNDYVSLSLAHPSIGPRRIYANLGQLKDRDDEFAILWNAKD